MKPILLHYYITNRCNARCLFCKIWDEQPKSDADPEHVLSNLYYARKAGCRFVDFTGGEPLLHADLPVFLKKAREFGYITSVTTNTLLFPLRARDLEGLIDLLHFSIDADNEQLNDVIHGCKTYRSVMESIPIALSYDLVPDLLFTYSDLNIDSFAGIYEYCSKNKLMSILDPIFSLDGKDSVSAETHRKALKFSKLPGVYCNSAHLLLRKKGGNNRQKPLCKAVRSTVVILPNNTIALPCYHHKKDAVAITPSLDFALRNPMRLNAFEEEGRYSFCQGCHINCYFDPSYTFLRNTLFLKSLYAKMKYAIRKYLIYKRPAPVKIR